MAVLVSRANRLLTFERLVGGLRGGAMIQTFTDKNGVVHRVLDSSAFNEPEPGERCETCHRRVPKKRQSESPSTKRIVAVLPPDRADALSEGLDNLQEWCRIDSERYPRGYLLELLLVIGAQHREEIRDWMARK